MALPDKPFILIVDDNEAVSRITSEILAVAGYESAVAESGEQAIRICEECARPVDLVISDVIMPGMSGPELCRRLAAARRARRCLLISGYSREQLTDADPDVGALPMLVKPFNVIELLETVRTLLAEPAPEQARGSA